VLLACEEPRVDFGEVWEGEVLEHEFLFTARGTEPLVVVGVKGDCGCTTAELQILADGARTPYPEGTPVPPGTQLVLGVTYDTHGRAGAGERHVKLFCNEADGLSEVSVVAAVKKRFRTEPDPPPPVRMAVGAAQAVTFDVIGVGDEPFRLVHEVRGLPPSVQVELAPVDPDPEGRAVRWRVDFACGPETPRGTHSYPVFLRAVDLPLRPDVPGRETHSFAPFVVVQVQGRFSRKPANLSYGGVGLDETVSRTVRVSCNDPDFDLVEPRVEIQRLTEQHSLDWAEHATVHVRAVPEERAWDVELVLRGLSPTTDRTFLGRLDIHTAHPLEPLLQVNVSGFRSDGGPR
jgi:hypothetical protein